MAEYISSYIYYVLYDDGTLELGDGPGFYIVNKFNDPGTSTGGDSSNFAIDDPVSYVDEFEELNLEYYGYVGGGWVGRENCGCGEPDYYLISNDGSFEFGDEIAITQADFTVCFLAGTAIACPKGGRPIEDLVVGDLVLTANGDIRPVRFVGRQTFAALFADPLRTRPIRIASGALGNGLPARDLCVSPDHALLVAGLLVQAGALVNGTTIAPMTRLPESFTYYHVELDDHSFVLAEGVPAETFVDNVSRRRFDNFAEFQALYGEATSSIAEMVLPRIKSARQLPSAMRERFVLHAGGLEAA